MPHSTTPTVKKRRWIDTTINLQAILGSLVGGAVALAFAYFGVVRDVAALKQTDQEHERRFARMEADIKQQRDDNAQQLRDISGDVKDIRRYVMENAGGGRPDLTRWPK